LGDKVKAKAAVCKAKDLGFEAKVTVKAKILGHHWLER